MYQTAQIKPIHYAAIKKIPVSNQQQVIEESGQPFEALKALQAIKDESKGYSLDTPKAKEADTKMIEWLGQNGFKMASAKPKSKQENQAKKQGYKEAIEGLTIMLDYVSETKRKEYADAIFALECMMSLL